MKNPSCFHSFRAPQALRCAVGLALALVFPRDVSADNGSALPYHAAPGATVTLPSWQPAEEPGTAQWYRDGLPLTGATGLRLTLPNVTAADSGTYRLIRSRPGFPDWIADYPLNVVAPPATPSDGVVEAELLGSGGGTGAWRNVGIRTVLADGRFVVDATWFDNWSAHWWSTLFFFRPDGTLHSRQNAGGYATPPPVAILRSGLVVSYYDPPFPVLNTGYQPTVYAAAETSDGRIVLVYRAGPAVPRMVRLFANGDLDPTFNGPAVTRSVRQLLVDSADRVLLCSSADGTSTLTRFSADGSPDATFAPVTTADLWPAPGEVQAETTAFTLLADDSLLATAQSPTTGDFSWRWRFRRVAADGSLPATGRGSIGESFAWSKNPPLIDAQGRAYLLNKHGVWRYFTDGDDALDPTFYGGVDAASGAAWDRALVLPDGRLFAGKTIRADGTGFKVRLTTLRTTDVAPTLAPGTELVSDQLRSDLRPGNRVVVTPTVFGTGPFTYEWRALDGGALPAVTTARSLVFENFSAANLGRYQLRVTGPGGTTSSGPVDLTPAYHPRLLALSGRGVLADGEETLIAGWSAAQAGYTLVRAVGPSLAQYGVTGFAADPSLTVFDLAGKALLTNDDWTPDFETVFAQTGASPLLAGGKDAAAKDYLNGLQTLHLANRGGARGVALAEIYDAGNSPWSNRLIALSLRGFAGRDSETLTGGFVLDDPARFGRPIRVLVRALGPTLAQYGLTRALADPRLTLHRADGSVVATNDNWSSGADAAVLAATMRALGLAVPAAGGKDAALELDLPPGAYTAQITAADGATGVGLLEIYRVK